MKEKERLELTFNHETERDLWEYINSLGKKRATNVKNIIRERMYADKIKATAAGEVVPQINDVVVPEVKETEVITQQENTESTFDASRSPLFKAKEI